MVLVKKLMVVLFLGVSSTALDGSLEDIFVINSVDPSLDKEAIRLVTQMPKWIPATQDGKLVNMYFILPVVFQLRE